jgi:RecB family exonuclease
VAAGLADLVLRMEAERGVPVVDRRLEERFDGVFELLGTDGVRRLPIRGVVDRIDLLADGALRVIDYKSSVPPAALQLAIYAVTAAQRLQGHRGRRWTVGEVSYVVFNGARVRPVGRNADDRARALADAQLRFVAAADAIHAGAFPPRPAVEHLCNSCAYAGVCRMDHVAEPEDADTAAAV